VQEVEFVSVACSSKAVFLEHLFSLITGFAREKDLNRTETNGDNPIT